MDTPRIATQESIAVGVASPHVADRMSVRDERGNWLFAEIIDERQVLPHLIQSNQGQCNPVL